MTTWSRRRVLRHAAGAAAAGVLAACSGDGGGPAATGAATAPPGSAEPGTAPEATATGATTPEATTPGATGPGNGEYVPPAHGAEWATVAPADAGFTDDGVAALVDLVGDANSQSFLLARDGRIVAEAYWGGGGADVTRDIASCQKSVVSTLVGLARDRGHLTLDDPVSDWLGAGWSAAPDAEDRVAVRHLLTMTSGLHPDTLRFVAPPGERWAYNSHAYQKLRRVLEAATGLDINTITEDWLLGPIGASAGWRWAVRTAAAPDPVGDEVWGLNLTVRDMARVGLLMARDGVWGETRLLPEGWLAEAWTPLPTKRDYGYLWWLIGKGELRTAGAPEDTVAALGAMDQKIYVIPSAGVVLCRQGDAAGRVSETQSDFDRVLLEALRAARA